MDKKLSDLYKKVYESSLKPEIEKIVPSGTNVFKVDLGGYEITLVKNEMLQDRYVILSPELYEKVLRHFMNQIEKDKL